MNGVEILSSTEAVTESIADWWFAGLVYLAIILIGGIMGFFLGKREGDCAFLGCLGGALVGLFIWSAIVVASTEPTTYETQYKVTIDDSVSMNEFLDKYEILDQEGKIYIVKERE
jgi:uncharacterized protein YcfJ